MTPDFLRKAALTLAGLVALSIGSAILLVPAAFYALSSVVLPDDVSLLNDIRAFGGGLVAAGIFIGLGLFRRSLTAPSLIAAALIYAGFGFARLWAIRVDGMPEATYLWVLAIELFVAAACALLVPGLSGPETGPERAPKATA